MDYDPVKDFSPVTLVSRAPNLLVVHPSMPANSVKELIALAKASTQLALDRLWRLEDIKNPREVLALFALD